MATGTQVYPFAPWVNDDVDKIRLVASTKSGTNSSGTTSSAIDTTGANLLVMVVTYLTGGTLTVSDSKGNTWTGLTGVAASINETTRIYYSINPTVGSGHTFTASGSSTFPGIAVAAFANADTSSPFDVQNGAQGKQAGSVTPSTNGQVLIAGLGQDNTNVPSAIDGGFTIQESLAGSGGNYFGTNLAYKFQSVAAASNPLWTSGQTNNDVAVIATFKGIGSRVAGTQVYPFMEWVEPGSGGGLTISVSDTIAISTTVARIASSFRLMSDSVAISATVARLASSFRQVGDTLGLSDAVFRAVASLRTAIDNIAIGDSVTAVLVPVGVLTILVQDFIAVSTNEQHTTQARRLLTDLVGLSDAVLRSGSSSRQVSDSVAVTNALSRVVQSVRLLADNIGVTDQISRTVAAFRLLTDSVAIGDSVTAVLVAAGVYLVHVLDTLGLSDTVSRATNAFRTASDALGLSDFVTRTAAHWRSVADSIGVLDATTVQLIVFGTLLIRVTDRLALTDSVGRATQSFRVLVDSIGIDDAFDLYIAVVIIGFVGFLSDPGGLGVLADTPGFGFLSGNS